MDEESLPVTIYVMDGEKVIEVIYGNEKSDVLQVDRIIIGTKTDPDTKKQKLSHTYKITEVKIEKSEIGEDELKVKCVIIA